MVGSLVHLSLRCLPHVSRAIATEDPTNAKCKTIGFSHVHLDHVYRRRHKRKGTQFHHPYSDNADVPYLVPWSVVLASLEELVSL